MIKNIRKSITTESIKEIRKINILLAFLAFPFIILMLFLFEERITELVVIAFKTSIFMFITGNLLVVILKYCTRKYPDDPFKFGLWRYCMSYATGIVLYLSLWPIFAPLANLAPRLDDIKLMAAFIAIASALTTIILFLHDFVVFRQNKMKTELEVSQLQFRTSQAENLLLKQQIHPHFLFNSLNTLKALYKKDNALGESYLIRLADFLRSAVSHNNCQATTLDEELHFCKNYMEMQQIRFSAALEWDLKINEPAILKGLVPSFSLQPLLENAIKHNIFTKESPLKVLVTQEGDFISISNAINIRKAGIASINSGLSNLAERYHLWSGEELIIKNDGITFSVSFKIIRNENSNS